MLKAKEHCCEESLMGLPGYIPCNRPATQIVGWKTEGPYRMCDMCAEHSIRNRGATYKGPYTKETE